LTDALLVPRHAIYEDRWVYVFEPDPTDGGRGIGRLVRREVTMLRTIGDDVLVDYQGRDSAQVCELESGDQLVVSSLVAPADGIQVTLGSDWKTATGRGQGRDSVMPRRTKSTGVDGAAGMLVRSTTARDFIERESGPFRHVTPRAAAASVGQLKQLIAGSGPYLGQLVD
jgi:hypothetical protein